MAKKKVDEATIQATRIVDFFEGYGAMFDTESRNNVIKRIANILKDYSQRNEK